MSLVLILCIFCIHRVYRESIFLLSTDSTYSHVPGDKGGSIFFVKNFFGARFKYKLVYYNLFHLSDFTQHFSNCIRSIWSKTNTKLLHTNSIHSILHKIGHVIQIVVHQFVHKTSAKKNPNPVKKRSPFILRCVGICRISTKEKKMDPL